MLRYIKKVKALLSAKLVPKFGPKYKLNHRNSGLIGFIDVGSIFGLPTPWNSNANLVKFLLNFEPYRPKCQLEFIISITYIL